MNIDLTDHQYYLNRELSWLEFNRRVLEEARDPHQPLLERVKFMCIVTSNLDEFFEIRVAGIKQQIENNISDPGPDGLSAPEIFANIRERVKALLKDQYDLWNNELEPALAQNNIKIFQAEDLEGDEKAWASEYFEREVFPVLTPLAVDPSHPFPQLANKSHNLIVLMRRPGSPEELSHAIVQIPKVLPRLVRLPSPGQERTVFHYFLLRTLIRAHVPALFPGLTTEAAYSFRVTRNSDLYIDEEEAENLLRTIEEELRKRSRGNAVRLEMQTDAPKEIQSLLLDHFKLGQDDLYINEGPLNMLHLLPLCSIDAMPQLRDKPFIPVQPRSLPPDADIFDVMRRQDVLLHHPYESFNSVVEFLEKAARDPQVLAIKMTLYRTSGDSPIVRALIAAAQNGKQVTTMVEVRARFDEANNINWARRMEEAGVHVVYGLVGLKTHCKMLMVVRRDEGRMRHYVHLGTGNYHPSTARFYTDLGLLTTNPELTSEVAALFNILTGLSAFQGIKKLIVAPFEMAERFHTLIKEQSDLAREGKPARIVVKINSLVDEDIIEALYEASQAGVKIHCIVRGICCLRPGVPGVSENIRVTSIVGRFLEHSRLYLFGEGAEAKLYLGSADWMPRNLFRRVEVVFPILDPKIRARLLDEIVPTFLHDCVKARELQPDGSYKRLTPGVGEAPSQAQLAFRDMARRQVGIPAGPASADGLSSIKIIPMRHPQEANPAEFQHGDH